MDNADAIGFRIVAVGNDNAVIIIGDDDGPAELADSGFAKFRANRIVHPLGHLADFPRIVGGGRSALVVAENNHILAAEIALGSAGCPPGAGDGIVISIEAGAGLIDQAEAFGNIEDVFGGGGWVAVFAITRNRQCVGSAVEAVPGEAAVGRACFSSDSHPRRMVNHRRLVRSASTK